MCLAPGHELDDLLFRPAAVVAIRRGQKSAMSAMLAVQVDDIRIGRQLRFRLRPQHNERVIAGMNNQRGNRDSIENARGASTPGSFTMTYWPA